jgi:hypothetical protein
MSKPSALRNSTTGPIEIKIEDSNVVDDNEIENNRKGKKRNIVGGCQEKDICNLTICDVIEPFSDNKNFSTILEKKNSFIRIHWYPLITV